MISPEKIMDNPYNPRQTLDETALDALSQSIKENGMMQPLTVRKTKEGYVLVAGNRRLLAARKLGMKKVPCMVARVSPTAGAVMSLVENIRREPIHFLEEARGMEALLTKLNLSPEDAAASLGVSPDALSHTLQLLSLTPWQRERIALAGLSRHHARAVLTLTDEKDQNTCLLETIAKGLTPKETLLLAQKIQKEKETPPATRKTLIHDLRLLENTLNHAVTTLNRCGLLTKMEKEETEFSVVYTLKVEKNTEESPQTQTEA